ncbi:MAG: SDR family NAD(P)-dependent oxidoreductase [Actinoplanes sp.]
MSVVLVTGAATGIGNLTALRLADAGHTVYASMRDVTGHDAERAEQARRYAKETGTDLHVIELDVTSQESADTAVQTVVADQGGLDVVINNAGHLYIGYVEAFTDQDVTRLIDINAVGAHRVNRAALPHFRKRRAGVLLYVGSTIPVTTPPFLGPYVMSKAAMDSLAVVTAYEANSFGIETVIVMPGAITEGTEHFPDASRASDTNVAEAYAVLDPLVERNEHATAGVLKHPLMGAAGVAAEIVRVLDLPFGQKPFRTVIDDAHAGVERVNDIGYETRAAFVRRLGFEQLLSPAKP